MGQSSQKFNKGIRFAILGALMVFTLAVRDSDGGSVSGPFEPKRIIGYFDGNFNDTDDIGAVAMFELLVNRSRELVNLVHLAHSNHQGFNDPDQYAEMIISADSANHYFQIPDSVVFDEWANLGASVSNAAAEINASSVSNPLYIAQGGPWHTMVLAFLASDPAKHQHATIVTHSPWNDSYQFDPENHYNRDDFEALYEPGGMFFGFIPPSIDVIQDQNGWDFNSPLAAWEWMLVHPKGNFVYERSVASGPATFGDYSDAGMLYYLVTGDDRPTMDEIMDFIILGPLSLL